MSELCLTDQPVAQPEKYISVLLQIELLPKCYQKNLVNLIYSRLGFLFQCKKKIAGSNCNQAFRSLGHLIVLPVTNTHTPPCGLCLDQRRIVCDVGNPKKREI